MSELAEAKKQAEIESDEAWQKFQTIMAFFDSGDATKNDVEALYMDFQACHNTERGLRHE